jgi:internalin A
MSQLPEILDDANKYPPAQQGFIVEMMKKFELCFDFPNQGDARLLIPELLRANEPDINWNRADSLNFELHYNLLPTGLISRFIVKMHHNLTEKPTYWRSGVKLSIDGNECLIRGDTEAGNIYVSVSGTVATRRMALGIIRDAFRAIHSTIPKIAANERVPLPDDPDVTVDYRHLLKLEQVDQKSFFPEGAKHDYTVETLLNGIEPPERRMEEREANRQLAGGVLAAPHVISRAPIPSTLDQKSFVVAAGVLIVLFVAVFGFVTAIGHFWIPSMSPNLLVWAALIALIIVFVMLALFTGKFGETTTKFLIGKVIDKFPALRFDRAPKQIPAVKRGRRTKTPA